MAYRFHNSTLDGYLANLIHAWKLDESSGTRYDAVGSINLTDNNTVGYAVGKNRRCADFVAANSEMLTNASDVVRNKAQISLSFWVRFDDTGTERRLISEDTVVAGAYRLLVRKQSDDTLNIGMRDSSTGTFYNQSSTNTFAQNTWYHVVIVFDTTNDQWYAWVNNTEWINVSQVTGSFSNDGASDLGFRLGAGISGSSAYLPHNGYLDEVYMWDTALSSSDATLLYNSGNGRYLTQYSFSNPTLDQYIPDIMHAYNLKEEVGTRADLIGYTSLSDNNTVGFAYDGKRGKCAYIDSANSEYLNNAAGFSQGKTQISINCWIKLESDTDDTQWIFWDDTSTAGYARCGLAVTADMQLYMQHRSTNGSGSNNATSTNTFSTGTWYHIAAVYDTVGDTLKAWVNGSEWINESISMDAFENATSASGTYMGARYSGTAVDDYFDGLIDELYVFERALTLTDASLLYNSGDGRYLTTEAERSGIDEYTVLLLHADGTDGSTTFTDSSPKGHTVTAGNNAQVDTAQKKFGTGSALFDGASDYLTTADSDDWQLNTNFTIDFWVRFNNYASPSTQLLFRQYINSGNFWYMRKNSANKIDLAWQSGGSGVGYFAMTNAYSWANNTWYHIAFVRIGTGAKMFINGVEQALTVTLPFGTVPNITAPLIIGNDGTSGTESLNGWLDEIRISKGVSRWTEDFPAPEEPYGDESIYYLDGESLLGLFADDATTGPVRVSGTASIGLLSEDGTTGPLRVDGTASLGLSSTGDYESGNIYEESGSAIFGLRTPAPVFNKYADTGNQWGTLSLVGVSNGQQLDMACVYVPGIIDNVTLSIGATAVCSGNMTPPGSTGTITLTEQNSSGISGTLVRTGTVANDSSTYWILSLEPNVQFELAGAGTGKFGLKATGDYDIAYAVSGTGKFGLSAAGDAVIVKSSGNFSPVDIPQSFYRVTEFRDIGDPTLMIGR